MEQPTDTETMEMKGPTPHHEPLPPEVQVDPARTKMRVRARPAAKKKRPAARAAAARPRPPRRPEPPPKVPRQGRPGSKGLHAYIDGEIMRAVKAQIDREARPLNRWVEAALLVSVHHAEATGESPVDIIARQALNQVAAAMVAPAAAGRRAKKKKTAKKKRTRVVVLDRRGKGKRRGRR